MKLGVNLILLTGCPKVLTHAAERKRAPGETKLGPPAPRRLGGVPGLKRTVTIAGPPERVWSVVVDVDGWPERVPTVTSVERLDEGPLVVGSRTRLQQPRLPTAVWTVTELTPGRSFTWESSSPGVTVTASHVVEPHPEGGPADPRRGRVRSALADGVADDTVVDRAVRRDRGVVHEAGRRGARRVGAPLENCPAGRDLDGGNTPCVQHQEPVTVPAAQHAGLLRERRDDVVDDLALAPRIAVVVDDVHAVAADEADAEHQAFHASGH